MSHKARRYNNSGPEIMASEVHIDDIDDIYYCWTSGCEAKMTIVNAGDADEAYFRRIPSSKHHISANCVRCSIVFDETKYDEKRFNKDNAFAWMYEKTLPRPKNETGAMRKKVGGGPSRGIRTLGKIYEMCVTKDKMDNYNGVLINDIFADEENYSTYGTALNGNMIVECSYYKKVFKEKAILFNYPTDFRKPHVVLRVNFNNEQECWNYYNRLKGCHHTEPIAIAGDWSPVIGNSSYQFQCDFISKRQIYFVK